VVAVHLERTTVRASAPELFSLKNQGLAFQRVAARSPYVLPLYGSSELTAVLVPERAHIFFRTAPTGFQVSPVGAGGANSLIMLQKIAALGTDLRGKKVAISLSPGWFLNPGPGWWQGYKGNFSRMAASEMAFGTALDFELKRDIASRMLKCPGTLENSPLLEFALKRLASGRWLDRIIFCALWPIGKAQTTVLELQDHFAAFNYIRHKIKPAAPFHSGTSDWSKLIASADESKITDTDMVTNASSLSGDKTIDRRDDAFRDRMNASTAWIDLELLLRTLARVHASPLLCTMPIAGDLYVVLMPLREPSGLLVERRHVVRGARAGATHGRKFNAKLFCQHACGRHSGNIPRPGRGGWGGCGLHALPRCNGSSGFGPRLHILVEFLVQRIGQNGDRIGCRNHVSFVGEPFAKKSPNKSFHIHGRFVGFNFQQGFAHGQLVARRFQPGYDLGLAGGLTEVRHDDDVFHFTLLI
jgi:D-alanine transfer protein